MAPVLAELDDRGLVSDARMAEAYVAERLEKGYGPLRVRHELRQRGVADVLIDPHLERTDGEWLRRLTAVHDKKFGRGRASDSKERGRRARFLEYRGFPSDLIGRFLHGDDPF
jgi:regulatory protein